MNTPVELEEIKDAIGECANMVGGLLKSKALDPHGQYSLAVPVVETRVDRDELERLGHLVYQLSEGRMAVEIWLEAP